VVAEGDGRRGITPSTALKLAKAFSVSADYWMNVQLRWDLCFARKSELNALNDIEPFPLGHPGMISSGAPHGVRQ